MDKFKVVMKKIRAALARLWRLCPKRHILLLAAAAVIGLFVALRGNKALMNAIISNVTQPIKQGLAAAFDHVSFSVGELLVVLAILALLTGLARTAFLLIRRPERLKTLYRAIISLASAGLAVYALFCVTWGINYYGDSFSDKSGIAADPVSTEDLNSVALYFASLANEYAPLAPRDGDGAFMVTREEIFSRSGSIYDGAVEEFPFLEARGHTPKPVFFSYVMSVTNYTGFFFPFTGEANLNTHSPEVMLPETVLHEFAHQRGIAAEQEANFVAVAAGMLSGDDVYAYSSALLAYVHLGNALYGADYDLWETLYFSLSDSARADLSKNSAYWEGFRGKVAEVSDTLYSGFLQSYGQTLGTRSYGACVDLLVAYYIGDARAAGF